VTETTEALHCTWAQGHPGACTEPAAGWLALAADPAAPVGRMVAAELLCHQHLAWSLTDRDRSHVVHVDDGFAVIVQPLTWRGDWEGLLP
jgi:hypothetical protein